MDESTLKRGEAKPGRQAPPPLGGAAATEEVTEAVRELYAFLEHHGVGYRRLDHAPARTCEEAEQVVPPFDGAMTKNLFVRDRSGRRHFLLATGYGCSVDLKALARELQTSPLSLASPDRLRRHLGVEPGAVTVLALARDVDRAVELVVDEALWEERVFGCHPLVNTATLLLERDQLERFVAATDHAIRFVRMPCLSARRSTGGEEQQS